MTGNSATREKPPVNSAIPENYPKINNSEAKFVQDTDTIGH
jgi:hypothetical protein